MQSEHTSRLGWLTAGSALMFSVLWVAGCAATQHGKSVENSGFLGDYSMLRKGETSTMGEDPEALMVYRNPKTNWKQYTKISLEPVTLWVSGKDSQLKDVPVEDRQRLGNILWSKIDENLRKDYEMTGAAGPDVMRIQVALTEAGESNAVLDTITSLYLPLKALSGAKGMATGVSAFTGSASAEMKITDTATGELLAAAVDRRGGTKSISGVTNSWHDVEEAFRFWAEKMRWRLCQQRGGANCVEPKP
ncbi:MAG: DUF3313 domain-containing protein [Nitrospiraceae bacterium]